MHDPIRFGILGCGIISPNHARAIDAAGGAVLIGAASRRYEQAQQFAQAFSCRAYETYADMLSDDAIDVVSICTPTGLHFDKSPSPASPTRPRPSATWWTVAPPAGPSAPS